MPLRGFIDTIALIETGAEPATLKRDFVGDVRMLRLDKLLSSRGYCTRSHARTFLKDHDVRENGVRIFKEDQRVDGDAITIEGEKADPERICVMLNKPVGIVCSHDDGEGELVYDLLPERWMQRNPTVTSVGRLDKETSGLLIITDDGSLVHRLTSPKKHVEKVYRVGLAAPLNGTEGARFASGTMMLESDPKPLLPAKLEVISEREARLSIVEGRYHQVRRMFAAVGNRVETLHRERVGELALGELVAGAWRALSPEDLAALSGQKIGDSD
jgi:16S rRNA pseudouridine516 synthase